MDWSPRTRCLLAAATGLAALLPPVAASWAEAQARRNFAHCSNGADDCGALGSVETDAGGLRLSEVAIEVRSMRITASAVEVLPTLRGIEIHLDGLLVQRHNGPRTQTPGAEQTRPTDARRAQPKAPKSPLRIANHGIPIRVLAPGSLTIEAGGASIEINDPEVRVDRNGAITAWAGVCVQHPRASMRTLVPMRAQPQDAGATWSIRGLISIADGPRLEVQAEVGRDHVVGQIGGAQTGRLRIEADRSSGRAWVSADGFALASLGSLAYQQRGAAAFDGRLATLQGDLDVRQPVGNGGGVAVHLEALQIADVTVRHPRLAGEDVKLGALTLDGDLEHSASRSGGQLTVEHDGVGVHVFGELSPERVSVHAELAPTSCQAALDAIPAGLSGVVGEMNLEGSVDGTLDLHVGFAALRAYAAGRTASPSENPPPPGRFELDFSPLEDCAVTADAAAIDLAALKGPYRHRFVDADGNARARVMSAGADGFVTLRQVPLLASAFTTLEDARYFQHDGFDRRHIERAVWHNLEQREISRGASTITQQAARNLFLGVDRTIARKLQEAVLAQRLEQELDKRRVLELYLNIIELGPGVHGVEEAAQFHFGKSASKLTAAQAVHIAKLAPAPNTYSDRWRDGRVDEEWLQDIHYQLKRLRYHHVLTSEGLKKNMRAPLALLDRR